MEKMKRKRQPHGFSLIELLVVMLIILVIAGMAIPGFQSIQRNLRIVGDSRNVFALTAQAKMRAAAEFTHARARMSLTTGNFGIEVWDKPTNSWQVLNGIQNFSTGVGAGFSTVSTPPPNTQATLGQAHVCRANSPQAATATLVASGDVCIEFNSRGIPVDNTGAPTGNDAFYITDGNSVYGVTVNTAGMIQNWYINRQDTQWTRR